MQMTGTTISPWRVFRADPAEWYSAEDISRSEAYVRPLRRLARLRKGLVLAASFALIGSHAAPELLSRWGIENWFLQLAVVIAMTQLIQVAIQLPFSAWRSLSYDRKHGFSTQTAKSFVMDSLKAVPLGYAVMLVLLTPLWAVVRATPLWWVWGWAVFAFVLVVLGILFPVVIAPLFNKYTPLEDGELRTEILAIAERVGADIHEVLVEDSSKRDTRPNAYVAGMGKVRRVVVYDNMLRYPKEAVLGVIAHEIGHWRLHHIRRMIPLNLATTLVAFVVLKLVLESSFVLDFAGVDSLAHPAAVLPFLLGFNLLSSLTGLPSAWLGRAYERQADLFGFETIGHASGLVSFFRDVAIEMKSDLRPSWWQRLQDDHPPFAERMAMATAWESVRTLTPVPTVPTAKAS